MSQQRFWVLDTGFQPAIPTVERTLSKDDKFCYLDLFARDRFILTWCDVISRSKKNSTPEWVKYIIGRPIGYVCTYEEMITQMDAIFDDIKYLADASEFYRTQLIMRTPSVGITPFNFINIDSSLQINPEILINQTEINDLHRIDFKSYPSILYITQKAGCMISDKASSTSMCPTMVLGPNTNYAFAKYRLVRFLTMDSRMYSMNDNKCYQFSCSEKPANDKILNPPSINLSDNPSFPNSPVLVSYWQLIF